MPTLGKKSLYIFGDSGLDYVSDMSFVITNDFERIHNRYLSNIIREKINVLNLYLY
jgi:hypothetical protein